MNSHIWNGLGILGFLSSVVTTAIWPQRKELYKEYKGMLWNTLKRKRPE